MRPICDTKHVAIIDDEASHREIGARFVKRLGHLSFEYACAEDLLEDIDRGHTLHLILLDMHMPRMNGLELLAKLREQFSPTELPILMITADSDPECIVKAFDLGANDYVVKQFDARTLKARIQTHLQLSAVNSQLRQEAEEARKSSQSQAKFFSVLTHELKTPIGITMGFAELIAKHEEINLTAAEIGDYGSMVQESANQLMRIVEDILTTSAYELGSLSLRETETDLHTVITDAISRTRPVPERSNISIDVSCPDDLKITCDATKLAQAISNILSNAVKFSLAGSHCQIAVDTTDAGTIDLKISDNGTGIETASLERVLLPFEQGTHGLDRCNEGLGLGLPIAKALLELHGGSIDIESSALTGTTVTLRVPAHRVEMAEERIPA